MQTNPVVWFEVVGTDGNALRRFYADLFGWQAQIAEGDKNYGMVAPANGGIGGGLGQSQDGGPGHVTFYVEVDDPAAYLARAEKLGGTTVVPPTEVPSYNLTFAYFTDPQGHLIGLSKGLAH
jgi:predicted enzyme related to lactoylglutathione lyase